VRADARIAAVYVCAAVRLRVYVCMSVCGVHRQVYWLLRCGSAAIQTVFQTVDVFGGGSDRLCPPLPTPTGTIAFTGGPARS